MMLYMIYIYMLYDILTYYDTDAIVYYTAGIARWTKEHLESLDRMTRNQLSYIETACKV